MKKINNSIYLIASNEKEDTKEIISYKAGEIDEEVFQAKKAMHVLGGSIVNIDKFSLPGTDLSRTLIFIKKEQRTPKSYPRKAGTPVHGFHQNNGLLL